MAAHVCPECGTPPSPDGRPGPACGCARAADLAARKADDIAAAEAFDPLRIRPYVNLGPRTPQEPEAPTAPIPLVTGPAEPVPAEPAPAAEQTMPLFLGAPPPGTGDGGPGPGPGSGAYGSGSGSGAYEPGGHERGVCESGTYELGTYDEEPRRRRTGAMVGVAAAVVVVFAAAAFAGGLFDSKDAPAALPATATGGPATAVSQAPSESVSPSASPSVSDSASASASASPSASPSPSSASPSASASSAPAEPSPSKSSSTPSAPPSASQPASQAPTTAPAAGTLRRGDSGPEVAQLQSRLYEVGLYRGPMNGRYGERVENAVAEYQWRHDIWDDPMGVYGPNTRRALEAETTGERERR
ncbi:peptidoglycan-binding domain-containing protein [Streptomyces purpureus]|uniref:Peptidoglycan-binding protein n=1 Tax=Streptomyces purpureus TaxID=1951 RepID=A0A918H0Q3_9ACTN|nr:peptidoglycan-binding domain-containing protein [Streptomyces purpureus]GGT26916.1 peptidoglycan-binding protein [Streptomyces purpureus]